MEEEADLRDTEGIFGGLGFLDEYDDLVEQLRGVVTTGVFGI